MNMRGPLPEKQAKRRRLWPSLVAIVLIAGLFIAWYQLQPTKASSNKIVINSTSKKVVPPSPCVSEGLEQLVLVSVSKRQLWACANSKQYYTSPVITGYINNVANITPLGTYKIYAKQTDRYLKGSDELDSWNEHVDYWMPFLYNEYGAYGFHDASWRKQSVFGKVSPYSTDASHGCVELPTEAAKWLYEWAEIGTLVKIVE